MSPIQCEVLVEPNKPSNRFASKKPKGTSRRSAAHKSKDNENMAEDVLPEHILSLLRPLAHAEPTDRITCDFVVPTYFKSTEVFIPKYKSFLKHLKKHPSARSNKLDPWKTYRNGLQHFLECEEHISQYPVIAITAYVIDRNLGINWGATVERKWDNAMNKGKVDNKGKKKRTQVEEEGMEKLHENVKSIDKGVKGLHRKWDSSQTLSKVQSMLDELA